MEVSKMYASLRASKMSLPIWYAIIIAFVLGSWLLCRLVVRIFHALLAFLTFRLLKHFIYPQISERFPALGTRYQLLALTVYVAVNATCMTLGTSSIADVSARSATMSLINVVPLLCGPRLVFMAELLGISLRGQHLSHSCFGLTAMAQALVHSAISVAQNVPFRWTRLNLSGVVGSSALGLILLLSLRIFRRLVYEWFLRSHLVLTVAAIVAIFLHLASKKSVGRVFLGAGVLLWTCVTVVHGLAFLVRNLARGRSMAIAQVSSLPRAIHVSIEVPRSWKVKAGQFIFLSIPTSGVRSALQSHPFMIAWWEHSGNGLTIYLLIKPRRGFTKNLASLSDRSRLAFVDGPYGVDYGLGQFGTVLMFATGIGIAGQMPHIKEIITGYNDCTLCTRRIMLIWQLDKEVHEQWVKQWMDAAIDSDTGHILEIELYVLERSAVVKSPEEDEFPGESHLVDTQRPRIIPYGTHRMLDKIFGRPNINAIIRRELASRKGSMVVSVCADDAFASRVRTGVQRGMDKAVRFVQLDFQPSLRRSGKETGKEDTLELDFKCRGDA